MKRGGLAMNSPVQQPHQEQLGQLTCTQCGKRFRYRPDLAGRTVTCPCGARIVVPRVQFAGEQAPDAEAAAKRTAPVVPAVGLSARRGAADVPFDDDDDDDDVDFAPKPAAPALAKTIRLANLPPKPRGLQQEERNKDEEVFKPSTLRDWIVPSILIAIGIALPFAEVMARWAVQDPLPAGEAVATVAFKVLLSIGLMVGGMFLAVHMMEICFLGPLTRTAYKLVAIGIVPGALYGILSYMCGDTYGAMIGTFASVIVYGVLFWSLLRLDLKEASMCVILTWILVTAANYISYKAQGLMQDSWV
jgi:DNA-directed RNA polymerase subunit RPC12/RpoP